MNPISTPMRRKILEARIKAARFHQRRTFIRPKAPPEVTKAERVLTAWERKVDRWQDAHYAAIEKSIRRIEDAVLLGDYKKVIALLAEMEA